MNKKTYKYIYFFVFIGLIGCNGAEINVSLYGGDSNQSGPSSGLPSDTFVLPAGALNSMPNLKTPTVTEQISTPDNFVKCGTTVTFTADDGVNGIELWKTDATAGGTVLLKDINTGINGSNPERLKRTVAGYCLFTATTAEDGTELWRTDGTSAGTTLVKNISANSGSTSFVGDFFEIAGGVSVFIANDSISGNELWRTDGTEAGTYLLKDIMPGVEDGILPNFLYSNFKVVAGKLFFSAADNVNGHEYWVTDGTSGGTQLIIDMRAGINSSVGYGSIFDVFNNEFYFSGHNGVNYSLYKTDGTTTTFIHSGAESYNGLIDLENGRAIFTSAFSNCKLYETDGTAVGTSLLRIFNYCYFSSQDPVINNEALLRVNDGVIGTELWITDGTLPGTTLLADIQPGAGSSFSFFVNNYFKKISPGLVLFYPKNSAVGSELWVTDGTPGGTQLLKDINPGSADSGVQYLGDLGGGNYVLYGQNPTEGGELWLTDGTPGGTAILGDINPGAGNTLYEFFRTSTAYTKYFNIIDGILYFRGSDSSMTYELGISDGTVGGTSIIKNINTQQAYTSNSYSNLFSINDEAILFDTDGSNYGIWKIEGSGTQFNSIKNLNNSNYYYEFVQTKDKIFYIEDNNTQDALWASDGTDAGTLEMVVPRVGNYSWADDLKAVGDKVFFIADDVVNGFELWVSDGTVAGSKMVQDTNPGGGNSFDWWGEFYDVNGIAYYWPEYAANSDHSDEPWRSDGTAAGTFLLKDINPGSGDSYPENFVGAGNLVFFEAYEDTTGTELYVSDGTSGNAAIVKEVNPGTGDAGIGKVFSFGDKVVFDAIDPSLGKELFISDGTAIGTRLIKDINPGIAYSNPTAKLKFEDKLLFTANDGISGKELWVTDGTEAGTLLLKDIYTGLGASDPSDFVEYPAGKIFFFTATSIEEGKEIWMSDGTEAGTKILFDIIPGREGSNPVYLKVIGDRLYFKANKANDSAPLYYLNLK